MRGWIGRVPLHEGAVVVNALVRAMVSKDPMTRTIVLDWISTQAPAELFVVDGLSPDSDAAALLSDALQQGDVAPSEITRVTRIRDVLSP